MPCIFENPLTEDDLLDAIDGTASASVNAHLEACAFCAKRRDRIKLFEDRLTIQMQHPSRQMLLEYQFNLLNPDEMDAITLHLSDCEDCKRILAEYAEELHIQVPKRTLPTSIPTHTSKFTGKLREIVTQLVPIMSPGLASLGRDQSPISITASAGGISLLLNIEPLDTQYRVVGQLVVTEDQDQSVWAEAKVSLNPEADKIQNKAADPTTKLDDLGNFTFASVAAGTYRLRIASIGAVVVFEPLTIP